MRAWFAGALITLLFLAGGLAMTDTASAGSPWATNVKSPTSVIDVHYYGHSTFFLEFMSAKILTDPFAKSVGYPLPNVTPDAVTISHEHFDHNAVDYLPNTATVFRGLRVGGNDWASVDESVGALSIGNMPSYHDDQKGAKRGKNSIFIFQWENVRLAHLGDLGHDLSAAELKQLGRIDVLFIPVGGNYTIDAATATKLIGKIKPKIAIPMHYKTKHVKMDLAPVDDFLKGKTNVKHIKGGVAKIDLTDLPKSTEIWVFDI